MLLIPWANVDKTSSSTYELSRLSMHVILESNHPAESQATALNRLYRFQSVSLEYCKFGGKARGMGNWCSGTSMTSTSTSMTSSSSTETTMTGTSSTVTTRQCWKRTKTVSFAMYCREVVDSVGCSSPHIVRGFFLSRQPRISCTSAWLTRY